MLLHWKDRDFCCFLLWPSHPLPRPSCSILRFPLQWPASPGVYPWPKTQPSTCDSPFGSSHCIARQFKARWDYWTRDWLVFGQSHPFLGVIGGDFTRSWLSLPLSHSTKVKGGKTSIFRGSQVLPESLGNTQNWPWNKMVQWYEEDE